MSGKSQSSLLVLVAIATIIILAWVFTFFIHQKQQASILASERYTKIGKYSDVIKGLSRTALRFAVDQATKKIAGKRETYFYNGPSAPSVDEMRNTVSEETLYVLNKYLSTFEFKDQVVKLFGTNFNCVDYSVDKNKLEIGTYDEKFPVGAYDSSIDIKSGDNEIFSKNDIYEIISRNRFWLLYRKFKSWTEETATQGELCTCLRTQFCEACGGNAEKWHSCAKNVLEKEVDQLEQMINDPYIKCYVDTNPETCIVEDRTYYDIGKTPGIGEECTEEWRNAPNCRYPYPSYRSEDLCVNKIAFSSSVEFQYAPSQGQERVMGAVKATFSCRDEKYELSTDPSKERYLVFSVYVIWFRQLDCLHC